MKKFFTISSLVSNSGLLGACSDPTTQMEFQASIKRLGNGRLEFISELTDYSNTSKILNDIDIDYRLHEALELTTGDLREGEYIPVDNTISYVINKSLKPEEKYQFRLIGIKSSRFISGEVDFIINNDIWNFRSVSVSCCRQQRLHSCEQNKIER